MRIDVVVHKDIEPLLREWRRSLGASRAERYREFNKLWSEFVRSIIAARGFPKTAYEDDSTEPPTYWCAIPGGGLARILVEPAVRVGLFSYVRRVLVIDLNFSPGLRGQVLP
jgi:hypothetical protein